jgi:ATP-dependent protease ClpP protease subunit
MKRFVVLALLAFVFLIAPHVPGLRSSRVQAAVQVTTPQRPLIARASKTPVYLTDGPLEDLLGIGEKEEELKPLVKPQLAEGERWVVRLRLANAPVDKNTAEHLIKLIEQASENVDVDFIMLELDTPGGMVGEGHAVVRAMERSTKPVVCVADGQAASMGFYILQGCDKRIMTERTYLMVHEPSIGGDFGGQPKDWLNMTQGLQATAEGMLRHESKRLKVGRDVLAKHIEHGQSWFMNVDEAVKVGAVDGVAGSVEAVASQLQHEAGPRQEH